MGTNPNHKRSAEIELEKHRLIGRKQLQRIFPVSTMTIWRWEEEGLLPRHFNINGRSFWRLSHVLQVLERLQKAPDNAC